MEEFAQKSLVTDVNARPDTGEGSVKNLNVKVDAEMEERVSLQTPVSVNPDSRGSIVNDVSTSFLKVNSLKKSIFLGICDPPCENGGRCRKSGKCKCPSGTRGKQCQLVRKIRKKS